MWKGKPVSVVLASYREKKSIRGVINAFYQTGVVDEVVVVDNNAEEGSVEEVRQTPARLVFERQQGHGFALRRGMQEAHGHYLLLCEGDGTFDAQDTFRFLSYAEQFPVVFGTRTNTSLIGPDSGMFFIRRVADVLEALLIEILFQTDRLTDVGCTYKLVRKDVAMHLEPQWLTGDSHFNTEVILQVAARNIPFVEIPTAFIRRVGTSSVVDGFWNLTKWAFKLFWFIVVFRLRWRTPKPVAASEDSPHP